MYSEAAEGESKEHTGQIVYMRLAVLLPLNHGCFILA